ncbi:DUF4249 domain-containing protein [Prolixibacter denitrificans]|uniref:Uncharacterized protein DUF4249 n=1 Tax=Prolixibacter denitrificans TaxID=1541063 RepID=A0A2P8C7V2_9BACT|nr:DUF4249 domain-containing protein [Prolixibacter denitrificans]PSK81041.1 uncharacterized protein DUF4249 [Prolixibacter denitrificans]GET22159.1 hypothetical protein JCM18694_24050 [Prolixibacter denitrificans]
MKQPQRKYVVGVIAIFMGIVSLPCCVEPFTPHVKKYSDLLVVDGTLTDEPGSQVVTVSRTSDYSEAEFLPENGCVVTILDDQGNIYPFNGKGDGKYVAEFYQGDLKYGRAYMLRVIAGSGDVYESDYQVLKPAPPIDSVTARYETKVTAENTRGLKGYQFFVNTSDPTNNTRYYRWSAEETWEYHAPYEVVFMWDGTLHFFSFPDNRSTCWKTSDIPAIYTATTRDMSEDRLTNVKLSFVSTGSERLKWRYSLLVTEYSLSAESYEFWNGLEKQTQKTGGLYEAQPYMIEGNISCVSTPDEVVLGFFCVSGVSKKRIFVGPAPDPVYEMVCNLDKIGPRNPIEDYPESAYPVYLTGTLLPGGGYAMAASERRCFDCLERGGTNVKPDFWED